jgi:hypothetical protein
VALTTNARIRRGSIHVTLSNTIALVSSQNQVNIVPKKTKVYGSMQHFFASLAVTETFRNDRVTPALKCGLYINGGLNFIVYNVKVLLARNR